MFAVAIAVIDILKLSETEPYNTIALGFVLGTLLTGFLYASRYIVKLKEAKVRLAKSLRILK